MHRFGRRALVGVLICSLAPPPLHAGGFGSSGGYAAGYGSSGGYAASYGSSGGYASTGGSSGGYAAAYGSSGGAAAPRVGPIRRLIANIHARKAARRAARAAAGSSGGYAATGSSGGYAATAGSSGGYSAAYGGSSGGYTGGSSGGTAVSYAPSGSSGGGVVTTAYGGSVGSSVSTVTPTSYGGSAGYGLSHVGTMDPVGQAPIASIQEDNFTPAVTDGTSYPVESYSSDPYAGGYETTETYAGPSSPGYDQGDLAPVETPSMDVGGMATPSTGGFQFPPDDNFGARRIDPMIDATTPVDPISVRSGIENNGGDQGLVRSALRPELRDDVDVDVADDEVLLRVIVPADAVVTVNDHPTKSGGTMRRFKSRGLEEGFVYTYEIKATFGDGDEATTETRTIDVRGGDSHRVILGETEPDEDPVARVAPPAADPVTVVSLNVPADATITLAGNPIAGSGPQRVFRTRQLSAGQSWEDYTVEVTAVIDGETVVRSKTIDIAAGSTHDLTFDFPAASPRLAGL